MNQKLDMEVFDDEIEELRAAVNARSATPALGYGETLNPMMNRKDSSSNVAG